MAREILIRPLTGEVFAPFGDVVEAAGADHFPINNGTTERFHDLAIIDTLSEGGRTIVSIARSQPFTMPLPIKMLERHPLGSQIFMPMSGRSFLVIVAEADKDGRPGEPSGFLASGLQGINYAKNTWHHPMIALDAMSDFLIIDRGGEGNNLEEHFFEGDGYVIANYPSTFEPGSNL